MKAGWISVSFSLLGAFRFGLLVGTLEDPSDRAIRMDRDHAQVLYAGTLLWGQAMTTATPLADDSPPQALTGSICH